MQIYNYDANGLYVGIGQADRSPLDEGEVYLIPAGATTIPVPAEVPGYHPCFNTALGIWEMKPIMTTPESETPEVVLTPERELELKKFIRQAQVDKIVVTTGAGHAFDGNEDAQNRLARSIVGLQAGESIPWVLADNTVVLVDAVELREALRLAGAAQTALWNIYQ